MYFSEEQKERYARHFVLKEFGEAGQKKLHKSKVLVIGAGGLGSPALLYLAAAGVGTLGIIDYDTVSMSNLQRQIIHKNQSLDIPKTESARREILALNPDVRVNLHDIFLTPDNILPLLKDYDFILDCTDRFEIKFLINDACVLAKKPFCHAGVVRFGGQVMTYVPEQGPCLRCLLGEVPKNAATCKEVGVLGAAVGVIGSIQALEAIKYLTGTGELLTGRILNFDGLGMNFRISKFPAADKECRVCGEHGDIRDLTRNRNDYTPS